MRRPLAAVLLAVCALLSAPIAPVLAQEAPAPTAARDEPLRVFIDCSGFYCDQEFFQTEIPFVSHVRDRQDADVHALITREATGSGGGSYTIELIGQARAAGRRETLRQTLPPDATSDDVRSALAQALKLGLVPFLAGTPAAARLRVSYEAPGEGAAAAARGPWNFWTFRASLRGFFQGESFFTSRNVGGSVSASRTTERWKTRLSASGSGDRSTFEIDDSTSVTSRSEDYAAQAAVVRSLGAHWSAGATASFVRSLYRNYDHRFRAAPAVEYDVFPYSESTRRQLTFNYSVGLVRADYQDTTVFGKLEETRVDHALVVSLTANQRWGSVGLSLEGAHFLDDPGQNRLVLFGSADVRLMKGLSLDFFGQASRIRDQLSLRLESGTPEDILLRQFEQATSFRYYFSVGLSYTFGSIYNTIVNPRFGGTSGGILIIE